MTSLSSSRLSPESSECDYSDEMKISVDPHPLLAALILTKSFRNDFASSCAKILFSSRGNYGEAPSNLVRPAGEYRFYPTHGARAAST